jgi:hypothetical protein
MGHPSHFECIVEKQQAAHDEQDLGRIRSSAPPKSKVSYDLVDGRWVQVMVKPTATRSGGYRRIGKR